MIMIINDFLKVQEWFENISGPYYLSDMVQHSKSSKGYRFSNTLGDPIIIKQVKKVSSTLSK